MSAKVEIVKRLGEQAVLLPSLIADALNANDRDQVAYDHAAGGGGSGGGQAVAFPRCGAARRRPV